MEGETDREKLTIVGVADVMETTSTILNTFSSNRTVSELTDGEKLTIVRVANVMETTSTIFNTSSSNGTVTLRWSLLCYAQYLFL